MDRHSFFLIITKLNSLYNKTKDSNRAQSGNIFKRFSNSVGLSRDPQKIISRVMVKTNSFVCLNLQIDEIL